MPLCQTEYGGVCPLGKFKIDIPAGGGCYTRDSVECCLDCNFADNSVKEFDLVRICQCPQDLSWTEYDSLRDNFAHSNNPKTRQAFWDFVNSSRQYAVK
jgi:hypothetical protein